MQDYASVSFFGTQCRRGIRVIDTGVDPVRVMGPGHVFSLQDVL